MTTQIFLEYSSDDFATVVGPLQISNNAYDNYSPSIWETLDGFMNILWKISGTVSGTTDPLVYLRERSGVFNEDNRVTVKDYNDAEISGMTYPAAKRMCGNDQICLVYWKSDNIYFRKGEPTLDSGIYTYVFSAEISLGSGLTTETRAEVIPNRDGSVLVFWLDNSSVIKGVISYDMVTFHNLSLPTGTQTLDYQSFGYVSYGENDVIGISPISSDLKATKYYRASTYSQMASEFTVNSSDTFEDQYAGIWCASDITGELLVSALTGASSDTLGIYVSKDTATFRKAAKA